MKRYISFNVFISLCCFHVYLYDTLWSITNNDLVISEIITKKKKKKKNYQRKMSNLSLLLPIILTCVKETSKYSREEFAGCLHKQKWSIFKVKKQHKPNSFLLN